MNTKKSFLIVLTIIISVMLTKFVSEIFKITEFKSMEDKSVVMVIRNVDDSEYSYQDEKEEFKQYIYENNLTMYSVIDGEYDGSSRLKYYSPGNDTDFNKVLERSYRCKKYCYEFVEVDLEELNLTQFSYIYDARNELNTMPKESFNTLEFMEYYDEHGEENESNSEVYENLSYFRLMLTLCIALVLLFTVIMMIDFTKNFNRIRVYSLLGIKYRFLFKDSLIRFLRDYYIYFILITMMSSLIISRSIYICFYTVLFALLLILFISVITSFLSWMLYHKISLKINYKIKNFTINIMSVVVVCISVLMLVLTSTVVDNFKEFNVQDNIENQLINYYTVQQDHSITRKEDEEIANYLIDNNNAVIQQYVHEYKDENQKTPVNFVYTNESFFENNVILFENGEQVSRDFINSQRDISYDEVYANKDLLLQEDGEILDNFDSLTEIEKEQFLEQFSKCIYFSVQEYDSDIVNGCTYFKIQDTNEVYNAYDENVESFKLADTIILPNLVSNISSLTLKASDSDEAYKIVKDAYVKHGVESEPHMLHAYSKSSKDYAYYDMRDSILVTIVIVFIIVASMLLYITLIVSKNKDKIMINIILGNNKIQYLKPVLTEITIVDIITLLILITLVRTFVGIISFMCILLVQLLTVMIYDKLYTRTNLHNYIKGELQGD